MSLPPSYSLTIVKVGLETKDEEPSPLAMPLVRQVFPAPRSPVRAITSPPINDFASSYPKSSVCSGDVVLNLIMPVLPLRSNSTFKEDK